MIPANRALTERLLATNPAIKWKCEKALARRPRSTSTKQPGRSGSRSWRAQPQRTNSVTPAPDLQFNGLRWKKTSLKAETFVPWLTSHLELIAKTSPDHGYSTFVKNLLAVLPNRALLGALNTGNEAQITQSKWRPSEQSKPLSILNSLRTAFQQSGQAGVETQLKYSYQGLVASRRFSEVDLKDQERLADLRYPVEWYPATRTVQRKIVLHVGPTNSGKTYHALRRLEQARSGIYAGPLRLLAHEVYTRLNGRGKTCSLVTGDEKSALEGAIMQSCTVEMVPLNADVDVAVIDEIQMIGSKDRGWAWTQALLGLKAREIHLCGEERSVPLIRELVASMGDELEINTYKRLSPLETMSTSLNGQIENLRKGDCVVVFSRVGIHDMKKRIEKSTQKRVAVVYGSLPPEVRAQQARLFNEPDNDYDILVASDAIGMGLNLAIKRIVFESVYKFGGVDYELIEPAQLKQIAGRAGRYRTAGQAEEKAHDLDDVDNIADASAAQIPAPNLGLVTTLEAADLPFLRRAMQHDIDPIMSAGIFPPTNVLTKFASYYPQSTSFSYVLLRLHELSLKHPRYHLCDLRDQTSLADSIQPIENLTTHDRMIFCNAPASVRGPSGARTRTILQAFARCVGERSRGALLDIPELPLEILDEEIRVGRDYMLQLETLHKALILYLWLSYRFAGVFTSQDMAFYVKKIVEEKIDKVLAEYATKPAVSEKLRKMREEALRQLSELDQSTVDAPGSQAQSILPNLKSTPDELLSAPEDQSKNDDRVEDHFQSRGDELEQRSTAFP